MPKIRLPSGRTVSLNFERLVKQLEGTPLFEGGRIVADPPMGMKLRDFVNMLPWLGLDLDSPVADLFTVLDRVSNYIDPDDDDDEDSTPA
jgi:hypothetical protein